MAETHKSFPDFSFLQKAPNVPTCWCNVFWQSKQTNCIFPIVLTPPTVLASLIPYNTWLLAPYNSTVQPALVLCVNTLLIALVLEFQSHVSSKMLLKNYTFCNFVVITASMTVAFLIMWPGTIMWNEVVIAVQLLST